MNNIKVIRTSKFHSFINQHLDFVIYHYSHPKAPSYQKYEESVGKSIISLACVFKAAFIHDVHEKNITSTYAALKRSFHQKIVAHFHNSTVYEKIIFGSSADSNLINSEKTIISTFEILISKSFEDNIEHLFPLLVDLIPNVISNDNTDFKTILQEFLQSSGRKPPKYETTFFGEKSHDLTFDATCYVGREKFTGTGKSKKNSEYEAARNACIHFNQVPKSSFKLIEYDFELSELYNNNKNYNNKRLNIAFGIPENRNIMQVFVPPRYKKSFGHRERSHRALATVGSYYIEYIKNLSILENCTKGDSLDSGSVVLANRATSIDKISNIFNSGLISKNELVFLNNEDFSSTNYQVDCVQALFAIGFMESIYSKEHTLPFEAIGWLKRRIDDIFRKKTKPQKHITALLVERLGSLGFDFRFIKKDLLWGAELASIKTAQKHEFFYQSKDKSNIKSEVLPVISGIVLKVLDRLEGYYFIEPKNENTKKRDFELFNYLFKSMTESFKLDKVVLNFVHEYSYPKVDYSKNSKEQLVELWESADLNIYDRANILYLIHSEMHLIGYQINVNDYYFLPTVFRKSLNESSFSIADMFSSIDEVDCFDVSIDNTHKNKDIKLNVVYEELIKNPISPINTKSEIIRNISNKDQIESAESESNDIDSNRLFQFKELYKNMNLKDLEDLWSNRHYEFDYVEEAAIVLSIIRFRKGIDFIAIDYKELCTEKIIVELELSSIRTKSVQSGLRQSSVLKESSEKGRNLDKSKETYIRPENLVNNTIQNDVSQLDKLAKKNTINHYEEKVHEHIKRDTFVLTERDEREFIKVKVATRSGQSNFRSQLIKKWKHCNITACNTINALDAAHIAPYRGEKDNDVRNGLLLRADIHRLFDAYLIGINPKSLTVHISAQIDDPIYTQYEGKRINVGEDEEISVAALEYHWLYYINSND